MAASNILSNILDVREVRPPTPQQLEAAYEALKDATEAVASIGWLIREVTERVDDEERPGEGKYGPKYDPPTYELIGRLAVYAEDAFSRLDEMRGYVDDVRKNLITLAEIQERWGK